MIIPDKKDAGLSSYWNLGGCFLPYIGTLKVGLVVEGKGPYEWQTVNQVRKIQIRISSFSLICLL